MLKIIFIKPDSSVLKNGHDFYIPDFSDDVHYEVEVLVKINKVGKFIEQKFAHKYYEEVGLGIDFTARDVQAKLKEKGLPWEKAKGFDGASVIGKWIDKTKLPSINNIDFSLLNFSEGMPPQIIFTEYYQAFGPVRIRVPEGEFALYEIDINQQRPLFIRLRLLPVWLKKEGVRAFCVINMSEAAKPLRGACSLE